MNRAQTPEGRCPVELKGINNAGRRSCFLHHAIGSSGGCDMAGLAGANHGAEKRMTGSALRRRFTFLLDEASRIEATSSYFRIRNTLVQFLLLHEGAWPLWDLQ